MLGRLVIDNVHPATPDGYPPKVALDERVLVSADVFRDGHDLLAARVRWRRAGTRSWHDVAMHLVGNDRWEATLEPGAFTELGAHELEVIAWTDRFATWRHDIEIKAAAGDDLETEFEEGARIIEDLAARAPKAARRRLAEAVDGVRSTACSRDVRLNAGLDDYVASLLDGVADPTDLTHSRRLPLWVDRDRARCGAWYEFFPRSEGGLDRARKRLAAIAELGFDIVYLPPIHPIGHTARKGRNNTLVPEPSDPGSPWAIGSEEGGHTAIHPDLGTIEDFDRFVAETASLGMEVALDYALQCSPDHPWVREHPEWYHHRPDGSIKYAENPPKKYQDIYPINFWPAEDGDRVALWDACRDILDYWIGHGVRVFRVDNPHTKPFAFWEWLIPAIQAGHPDVVFLAEAFTRPKVMAKLAEIGFTQSYTYFTWRTAKWELEQYLTELSAPPLVDFFRPNFWPNTPDILSGPLRSGPPGAFRARFVLAATMVPNYGMYAGYELCENEPASEHNEEYLHSEKYEIKHRDWASPESLAPLIAKVNEIRRRHPAFAELRTIRFHYVDNDQLIAYSKTDATGDDVVLCVVNLDPGQAQEGTVWVDHGAIGFGPDAPYEAHDELTGQTFTWHGPGSYVRLAPDLPAHILHLRQP